MKTIGFIGGGRVTGIILQAFENKNFKPGKITVYDPNLATLKKLAERFHDIKTESELSSLTVESDVLFLAVHPPVLMEILSKIKPILKQKTILVSLAPKITIAKMNTILNRFCSIARVNPSATAIINEGINPVAFSEGTTKEVKEQLLKILRILGKVPVVAESKIEAYAMISAMGSTYFWFQLQHLKELALKYGMDEEEAHEVIADMVKSSVNTFFKSGLTPVEVFDLVPVKPLAEHEDAIKSFYSTRLDSIFEKIKP